MAIDGLLAELEHEAEATIAATLERAQQEASRIDAEREERRSRRRAELVTERRAEAAKAAQIRLQLAERAAARDVLNARDRLLERVFQGAARDLPAVLDSEWGRAALRRQLEQALAYFGEGAVVVRGPQPLLSALGDLVARLEPQSETAASASAQILVQSADGRLTIDLSPAAQLKSRRHALAVEILRQLGSQPWHPPGKT